MRRLEAIVAELPEAERIDIEAWDDHPAFKVRKKNFVFADQAAESMSVKLSKDEAAAVVASDDRSSRWGTAWAVTAGSRSPWTPTPTTSGGRSCVEWVRTSSTLVAPKSLARIVLDEDADRRTRELRRRVEGGGGMARRERRRCLGLVHIRAVDPVCSPQTHLVNDRNGANPIEVTLTAGAIRSCSPTARTAPRWTASPHPAPLTPSDPRGPVGSATRRRGARDSGGIQCRD